MRLKISKLALNMTLSTIVRLLYINRILKLLKQFYTAAAVQNLHWLVIICLTQFIQLTNYTFSEPFLFPCTLFHPKYMYNLLVEFTFSVCVCVYLQSNKCFLSTFYMIYVQFVCFFFRAIFLHFSCRLLFSGNTIVLLTITSIFPFL